MRVPNDPETPLQVNIVPMIDVVFAILTFFIVSTLFLGRTEGLPVNLPKAATAKTQAQTRITITIQPNGNLALNKQPVQLDQIKPGVESLVKINQQPVVVINADERVAHGQVVAVMDQVKQIPGVKMAIATKRP
ncbi:ExbD/TolR family protein [Pantanalinema sp. GBBB05]|uniref:ExbD/TolR family protein n=1 Tax=Pantanalinema sp. GBBB05 TaxID=2604139 RepID=UPI001D915252|nr:biopolymer transporter ExbD [Pantanalinema sp. GBBB05]